MKRLVVKIGTNVLTRPDGTLDVTRVSALVDQVVGLRKAGWAVVLVSSGAVACGRTELRLDEDLDSVEQRQLYSAVRSARFSPRNRISRRSANAITSAPAWR